VQITREGGCSAFESPSHQTQYYAKRRNQNPEIWQVPVNGGAESRISLLRPSSWASWAIAERGILLLSEYNDQASEPQYFDFASTSVRWALWKGLPLAFRLPRWQVHLVFRTHQRPSAPGFPSRFELSG
jgi:hypothetical protein